MFGNVQGFVDCKGKFGISEVNFIIIFTVVQIFGDGDESNRQDRRE